MRRDKACLPSAVGPFRVRTWYEARRHPGEQMARPVFFQYCRWDSASVNTVLQIEQGTVMGAFLAPICEHLRGAGQSRGLLPAVAGHERMPGRAHE